MRNFFYLCLALCAFCSLALAGELKIQVHGSHGGVSADDLANDRHLLRLVSGGRVALPAARVTVRRSGEVALPVSRRPFPIRFRGQTIPGAPFGELIETVARRHDLNPELIRAIVRCESGYDPHAESPLGARGLLQLMPETAARFGVEAEELADPERNLEAGARYLSWLARHFDEDLDSMVAAFNSGEGAVDRYDGVPPYRETRAYLARVYEELDLGGLDVDTPTAAR